ncbi:MAG: tetratricopeptide repeat protein [Chthoniobacterales bacterium]
MLSRINKEIPRNNDALGAAIDLEKSLPTLSQLEASLDRAERTYIRFILGSVGALVVLMLLGWGGFRAFRHWQEGHLVRRAAAYMAGGDLKIASLTARRALQLAPDNPDANRVMAEIAEKAHDPSAVELRRKVFELSASSVDDGLALVRAALWSNDLTVAEKTLNEIAPAAKEKSAFHAASGRLAEMKKDLATAETEWARAVELAPNESGYGFQLALTRLETNDPAKREEALAALEALRSDKAQRAAATRTLMIDAVQHRLDPQRVRALAEELQGFGEASFGDRLMYLEILRQLHDTAYGDYLARLKKDASKNAGDVAALLSWMLRNAMEADALQYADTLPDDAKTHWPVPMVLAEARAQMKDWNGLEEQIRDTSWGGFDFLRHAYLSRALRGQDNQLAFERELSAAQKEASAQTQNISKLAQTLDEWGWKNEATDMLWLLAKDPATKAAALRTLYQYYAKSHDSSGLYRTLVKLAEMNPSDMALQNNLAQISLLIGVDLEHARKLAADVSAKEPSNPAYRSTYAFALLSNGDVTGAMQAMKGLSEDQLRDPAIAPYYGLVLAAAGEKEKAREFLQRADESQLLPEEKALIAKAESNLQ